MLFKGLMFVCCWGVGLVWCLGDNMYVEFRGEFGGVSEVVYL